MKNGVDVIWYVLSQQPRPPTKQDQETEWCTNRMPYDGRDVCVCVEGRGGEGQRCAKGYAAANSHHLRFIAKKYQYTKAPSVETPSDPATTSPPADAVMVAFHALAVAAVVTGVVAVHTTAHLGGAWPLPAKVVAADGESVSVSGISSGADFAVQLQVAYSEVFAGVGVFAG